MLHQTSLPFQCIIFDLGGVLFDIDYQLTMDAFQALGWNNVEKDYQQSAQNELFDAYECGKVSTKQFLEEIRALLKKPDLSDHSIANAWNAMLLGLPSGSSAWMEVVKKQVPVALLSNTNELHITEVRKANPEYELLEQTFDRVLYSHELGLRKPHAEVFREVCRQMQVLPGEALFIDDSIQHVIGARNAGLRAMHYRQKPSIIASGTTPQEFLRQILGE